MEVSNRGPFEREVLGTEQSLFRLAEASLARVLISIRCLPAALPVMIHVATHHVILASTEDAVIEAAERGDVLAVQVDGSDDDGTTWSVQVTGSAHLPEPTDPDVRSGVGDRLAGALDAGATLVAIPLTVVHGERVRWSFPP